MHSNRTVASGNLEDTRNDFDDAGDDLDDELDVPEQVEQVAAAIIPKTVILLTADVGSRASHQAALARINHHFRSSDLGYRPVADDTFKLRIRSRRYPLFGSFTGLVHVIQRLDTMSGKHTYRLSGLLKWRLSLFWVLGVVLFYALLIRLTHPGAFGVPFFIIGVVATLSTTWVLGRDERFEAEDRLQASVLRLRTTIDNLR